MWCDGVTTLHLLCVCLCVCCRLTACGSFLCDRGNCNWRLLAWLRLDLNHCLVYCFIPCSPASSITFPRRKPAVSWQHVFFCFCALCGGRTRSCACFRSHIDWVLCRSRAFLEIYCNDGGQSFSMAHHPSALHSSMRFPFLLQRRHTASSLRFLFFSDIKPPGFLPAPPGGSCSEIGHNCSCVFRCASDPGAPSPLRSRFTGVPRLYLDRRPSASIPCETRLSIPAVD